MIGHRYLDLSSVQCEIESKSTPLTPITIIQRLKIASDQYLDDKSRR
jgi:hypothetical protein